ncbi:immunoglobulin superfamily member 5 [Hoplias malabaricus]|uniref:immunoglobulin superfamily member 5 n=1 Tax=Hoplias malabaricus TaxID=27720 RepID=UPI0034634C2A
MDSLTLTALLLFFTGGVTAQVQLEPQTALVLRGSDAKFNCSTRQPGWTVMNWSLNSRLVVTIVETTGVLNSSERFSVVDYSTAAEAKWEFIIRNVSRNDSGQVSCQILNGDQVTARLSVQESGSVEIVGTNRTAKEGDQVNFQCVARGWFPTPQISWTSDGTLVDQELFNTSSVEVGTLFNSNSTLTFTALRNTSVECLASIPALTSPQRSAVFLTVEKKPVSQDRTVLIAVTVSISAVALLILIIIAIVLCCKRRKKAKSNYQEQARAHSRSQIEEAPHAGEGQGQDNLGYATEPKANDANSEYTDSGFWQPNYISTIQIPGENSNQEANPVRVVPTYYNGVRKHRHVTIV